MNLPEDIKNQIIEALRPLDPEKAILFGSYANGTPHKDSDIDLYIVTKDDFIPKNFKEKMDIKLKYVKQIRSLREKFPIDLIVNTKKMNEKFLIINSSFCKELSDKGIIVL